jgi:hypothetical protein
MNEGRANQQHDFMREFLYGPSDILSSGDRLETSISMDERMEGWIGIPHGGISMGIMTDLLARLDPYPSSPRALYPLSADFRLGGASLRIGDSLHFEVASCEGGAKGEATVKDDPLPYMSSSFLYGQEDDDLKNRFLAILPDRANDVLSRLKQLPSYQKCFVCGQARNHPGLRRVFHQWDVPGKIVIATAGFSAEDAGTFFLFQRNGVLHPLPFLALLDETLGWGGFLLAASGAVTVKIQYTFYRPVRACEKLIFFGRGDRVRGKSRLFFWASGGAAAVMDDGKLEMVVSAAGQFYGLEELTRQMKMNLMPKELMERAFGLTKS